MNVRRWLSVAVGVGLLAYTVTLAMARPPGTDAERKERIEKMYAGYREAFLDVPEIDAAGLLKRLEAGDPPVLVDVREPSEQAVSMLPGAITKAAFDAEREAFAGREVVTYCTIGARSGHYAQELRNDGIEAFNLAGSLLAWTHVAGPLERDGSPTKDLHVYGSRWNLAHSGYRGVW